MGCCLLFLLKLQAALACVDKVIPTKPSIETNNAALIDLLPNMLSPNVMNLATYLHAGAY